MPRGRGASWCLVALVPLLMAGCATTRAKDVERRSDAPTAIIATQKAGLPSHMNEADPDNVERRFGTEAARVRREQRAKQAADARLGVVDTNAPAPR